MESCKICSCKLKKGFKFCPNCGVEILRISICNKCSNQFEIGSKFCQYCGSPLTEFKESFNSSFTIDEIPLPEDHGITIEFYYSTGQTFEYILNIAKKFHSLQKYGIEKSAVYRINVLSDELESVLELVDALRGVRKRNVYVDGKKELWENVFKFHSCFNSRKSSFKPEFYCFGYEQNYQFNLWGCIQSRLSFREGSNLFYYGRWLNKDGDWQFDKDRILHELQKHMHPYKYCPAMDLGLVQEVLDALPDLVNPKKNRNWEYIETSIFSENSISYTIRDEDYTETRYRIGVRPANKSYLTEIIKNIKRKLPDFIKS